MLIKNTAVVRSDIEILVVTTYPGTLFFYHCTGNTVLPDDSKYTSTTVFENWFCYVLLRLFYQCWRSEKLNQIQVLTTKTRTKPDPELCFFVFMILPSEHRFGNLTQNPSIRQRKRTQLSRDGSYRDSFGESLETLSAV
jgi:hypothetical protein